jgi:hypothetical protein
MKSHFLYSLTGLGVLFHGLASPVLAAPASLPDGWRGHYKAYTYAGPAPDYRGVPVLAYVSGGGLKTLLKPNQAGGLPRVFVASAETVQIILVFPQGTAGEQIRLTALDGGSLDGGEVGKTYTLDTDLKAVVSFTVSANDGTSRVGIDAEGQSLGLDFWVGTPPHHPQIGVHSRN